MKTPNKFATLKTLLQAKSDHCLRADVKEYFEEEELDEAILYRQMSIADKKLKLWINPKPIEETIFDVFETAKNNLKKEITIRTYTDYITALTAMREHIF